MPPAETKPERLSSSRAAASGRQRRSEELLGLFAWHQDAPLVARDLRLTLDELQAELDDLGIRRKAFRLVRGAPGDVPRASQMPGATGGPRVRRRIHTAEPATTVEPPPEPSSRPAGR